MAIVTYPLNGITYNAEDAETYLSTRISGIYAADDCFDLSITGSAAAAPDVVQTELVYELGLYTVSVAAGSTVIKTADVTDTRLNEQVCGLMRDGVTGLPTAQIARQADALLDAIKAEYRGVKDGSGYVLTSNTIADSAIDSIVEG